MNPSPEEKPLQSTSFIVHATRGVIRDQQTRRKAMVILLACALMLLICGATFLAPLLNPREHLIGTLLFWLACIWLTLTAMLLAIFDLLAVRLAARRADRELREKLKSAAERSSPGRTGISNP